MLSNIKNFFLNTTNLKVLNDLSILVKIKDAVLLQDDGLLRKKTFMFTGKLTGISRAEAKSLIEDNSGSIVSNVSKKLDYLVVGEKPTKRKIDAAKDLKVRILSQTEWYKMLNKTS